MNIRVMIDLEVPDTFQLAQLWYPDRKLLEHVAACAVKDYVRNVVELYHFSGSGVNHGA